jgi:hypothetical protein
MSMQAIAGSVSPEDIQKLLKKGRTRGDYESVIRSFLQGGEAGVEIDLVNGPFAGKTGSQVKIGLDNARKRVDPNTGQPAVQGGHSLKIVKVGKDPKEGEEAEDQHVYIIDTSKVQAAE